MGHRQRQRKSRPAHLVRSVMAIGLLPPARKFALAIFRRRVTARPTMRPIFTSTISGCRTANSTSPVAEMVAAQRAARLTPETIIPEHRSAAPRHSSTALPGPIRQQAVAAALAAQALPASTASVRQAADRQAPAVAAVAARTLDHRRQARTAGRMAVLVARVRQELQVV